MSLFGLIWPELAFVKQPIARLMVGLVVEGEAGKKLAIPVHQTSLLSLSIRLHLARNELLAGT